MQELIKRIERNIGGYNFSSLALAQIDFKNKSFESYSLNSKDMYFDLASLTKPLTLAVAYLDQPDLFSNDMKLLLNHQSGLNAWGRLSHNGWQEQLNSYYISKSNTVYSDFGALRLQLEIEKKQNLYDISSKFWDPEIIHWTSSEASKCIPTGRRNRQIIQGQVHDDNAYVLGGKLSHAGLFGTIDGLCRTLLKLDSDLSLIEQTKKTSDGRFVNGWDSVENPDSTLAGIGATKNTFGHLGFTGTSMWITPETMTGVVLLTNETIGHWYDRKSLNTLRKELSFI